MEMSKPKGFPVGVINFASIIRNNGYYVDKTHLVGKLLDNVFPGGTVLFTRPRRFGKTLALDMLHCFFDCTAREQNRSLFEGLAVSKSASHMAEQGQYPVIRLSFNSVRSSNWQEAQKDLIYCLSELLRPCDYLQNSDRLRQIDKDTLWLIRAKKADSALLRNSLRLLSDMLYAHHGQPVVLLIDEYDVPIQQAYQHNYYEEMIDFMRTFFAAGIKDNPHLRLAVLTGVMRIAKESLFSGLNNLDVDTILSKEYADCFGFTQAEVEAMAINYSVPDKIGEIKAWYDGYRFGELDIYNPWSVLGYFSHGYEATAYWLDTSGNDLVIDFLRHLDDNQRQQIENLYLGGTVTATLDTTVAYRQLDYGDADMVFSLMVMTGYLKPIENLGGGEYELKIPNAEINRVFAREIKGYLERTNQASSLNTLCQALRRNDSAAFETKLQEILLRTSSYFNNQEAFYHGFMLCVSLGLDEKYRVLSEREAGVGRADILLQPRCSATLPGFVFELKQSDNSADLDQLAEAALQQIAQKRYTEEFSAEIREVRCYALAFCKKECVVKATSVAR